MKMKLHETKNDLREKTRRAMIDLLNQELADVLDLGLQAKQAHWNVKGPHFIGLHELFDKVAEGAGRAYRPMLGETQTAQLRRVRKRFEFAASTGASVLFCLAQRLAPRCFFAWRMRRNITDTEG